MFFSRFCMETEYLRQVYGGDLPYSHYYWRELDSSQKEAHRLLLAGEAPPFVVTTSHQTDGYGRQKAVWVDSGCDILASFVFDKDRLKGYHALMLLSLAAWRALQPWLPLLRIKWPNDLWVSPYAGPSAKVCGMIAENRLDAWILGIGINMYGEHNGASSVSQETGIALDIAVVYLALLTEVERALAESPQSLWHAWRAQILWIGEKVCWQSETQSVEGTLVDVDGNGAIYLESFGTTSKYYGGQISCLRSAV